MIELVKQHHPGTLEEEIRRTLNRAQDDFCSQTEILETSYQIPSVIGQRMYKLHEQTITLKRVEIDDVEIPRLKGMPQETDLDLE